MYSSDDEEVEDEEHGSSTLYAVIALCFCSLGNLHSEYLTCVGALLAFMHHFLSAVTHSEQLHICTESTKDC